MRQSLVCWVFLSAAGCCSIAGADSTGLIRMPDGRFDPDGTLRFGTSWARPYFDLSANATLLPWLETNLGVTRINGVPAFSTESNGFGAAYGSYKDKTGGLKIRLMPEEGGWPSVALGAQDPVGTRLFERQFVAATKTLGDAQVTLGYGRKLIDGAYGGARYSPSWLRNWSFVAEYDASDYKRFPFADESHVASRTPGMSYAIEYRLGWVTTALSNRRGVAGLSAYVALPLERKEWIPKVAEPEPYVKIIPRPTLAQWEQDAGYRKRMYEALHRQDFKDVRIRMEPNARIEVTLTNSRISQMSRAAGRAARTVLLLAPIDTTEIRITYTTNGLPLATYEFFDLQKLNRYFNGMLTRQALAESVAIRYAASSSYFEKEQGELMAALAEPTQAAVLYGNEGNFVSFKSQDTGLNRFQLKPMLSTYLNGPNVFQYNLSALALYNRELAQQLFLQTGVAYTLYENISDAIGVSNSELPHVRSNFADYSSGPKLRIDHVLLNRVVQFSERTYGRLTGGLYEQMYGGVGGQWLYVERGTPWAFDVSVDAVKQRDIEGRFGFNDYRTVTALAALHYKLPYQSTVTLRAGRFLARDYGVRTEIKRRFRIGIELGAWYTVTDAVDAGIGNEKNYRDKGVFVSIPFEALLAEDTRATGGFSLAPWTRDVGQMVRSPVDLYEMIEKPMMLDMHKYDGLSRLGDMEDDYHLPSLGDPMWDRPFENLGKMTARDWGEGASAFGSGDTWERLFIGTGVVLGSAVLDRPVSKFYDRRSNTRETRAQESMGNGLPVVAMGAAALAALSEQDQRLSSTGLAALQAGATGLLVNLGLKPALGRARPVDDVGPGNFEPFKRSNASLPSNNSTVMWAAITPFAREYEAPWLYGLAMLTNAGGVASRRHWVSDMVASSLLGFALGDFFWEQRRKPENNGPKVVVSPTSVMLMWETK